MFRLILNKNILYILNYFIILELIKYIWNLKLNQLLYNFKFICNIIHIIFTIILRKATKNIKSQVPLLEKEDKDIQEIVEDNNENSDNFIKFDNEINGPPTMKFIKYINTKLGV